MVSMLIPTSCSRAYRVQGMPAVCCIAAKAWYLVPLSFAQLAQAPLRRHERSHLEKPSLGIINSEAQSPTFRNFYPWPRKS